MAERARGVDAFDQEITAEGHAPLRAVPAVRTIGPYERFVKPVLDRIFGVVMTILTAPLLLIVVPLIWMKMGRPAIFRQQRIGRYGKPFTVYKLRTMAPDRRLTVVPFDGTDRRVNHKSDNDPRHTELGRFLRKWSVDEVPQFWNVAKGSMSVVGPRPEIPTIVDRYEPWQHRRHEVKPGLTGRWQVSVRGDIPMHEATDVDIAYVDTLSFIEDSKIILRTPGAMLGSNKGN